MRGLDDHINRCTACGSAGCFGTCGQERRDEVKPIDGDCHDDARAADEGLDTWDDDAGMSALEKMMFE